MMGELKDFAGGGDADCVVRGEVFFAASRNASRPHMIRITGLQEKLPRARLTFARPPRCVTGVEVVENVDVNGVGCPYLIFV